MSQQPETGIPIHSLPHEPVFSKDFFSWNIHRWEILFRGAKGLPNLRFLEVGVFEGRSTHWLLTNVLTHPTSRITCVDTFKGSQEHQPDPTKGETPYTVHHLDSLLTVFQRNIDPFREQVEIFVGSSQEILRTLPLYSYEMAYIDGSHTSSDVLEDAILAFRLLKPGGVMIFDDYPWKPNPDTPRLECPAAGIDAFLDIFQGQYEVLLKDYQVFIRKTPQTGP